MNSASEINPVLSNGEFEHMCSEIYSGSYDFQDDPHLMLSLIDRYDPYEATMGADPDDPEGVMSYCWDRFFDDHRVEIQGYIRETYSDPLFVFD